MDTCRLLARLSSRLQAAALAANASVMPKLCRMSCSAADARARVHSRRARQRAPRPREEYFGTIATQIYSSGYKSYSRAKRIQGVPWGKSSLWTLKVRFSTRMTQNADSAVLHVLSVQTNTSCSFAEFSCIGLFGKAKQEKKEQKLVAVVLISTRVRLISTSTPRTIRF